MELDAFTTEHGTGESAATRVAEIYGVSEMVVETALVNHKMVERRHLAAYQT